MSDERQAFEAWYAQQFGEEYVADDGVCPVMDLELAYRAGLERAAGICKGIADNFDTAEQCADDATKKMVAAANQGGALRCWSVIFAALPTLDADSIAASGPKIDDTGASGARVADGGEMAEKTPQIADKFLDQPEPVKNDHPAVWDLVIEDMRRRDHVGLQRYGTRLQPHNGRDALKDAYAEILDLAVYLRQEIYEREGI